MPLRETISTLKVEPPAARTGLRKLDPENDADLEWIYRLTCDRTAVSDLLGAWTAKLLMFHCLYTLLEDSNAHFYPPLRLPGTDVLFPYSSHA